MTFQLGNSGNPGGRRKEKIFADQLKIVLNEEIDDPENAGQKVKKVRIIANRLVVEAMAGEAWAIQQVMDRMDGKPAQSLMTDPDGSPLIVEIVKRTYEDSAPG